MAMQAILGTLAIVFAIVFSFFPLTSAWAADEQNQNVSLIAPAGAPLRVYLTKRISKRAGAPVQAKLVEPIYAFDREVVPAGCAVLGRVSRVEPVGKWQRVWAMMGGDFTPLKKAQVEFTALTL